MSMMQLALSNVKSSFKNYVAIIVSLAFTVLVFLNFQNIVCSDIFDGLGGKNKEYINTLIQVISLVLGCFMFFFLWYASNVFLTKRKKEIGIYIFMGLTNQKIARLYVIEIVMIGVLALVTGIVLGVLVTQLFQMILLAISDITVDISFQFAWEPVLITAAVYLIMYVIFAVKGYVNIVRSSVLEMVSAARKNEYVRQNAFFLLVKTVLGVGILIAGYYLAIKEGGQEVMGNVFAAVVLVVVGVYLLFGGFLPVLFQNLAKRKHFLYQKERNLWINQMIFRMKKNYRTYAMTCVLMLCSVTALATGFAMKSRYESMVHFRNTYTYQLLSNQPELDQEISTLIEKDNQIAYSAKAPILLLESDLVSSRFQYSHYAVLSYSDVKRLAASTGLDFELEEPGDDEIIQVSQLHLLSLLTDRSHETVMINGKTYQQIADTSVPYLGYLQEQVTFYLVNDAEYEKMLSLGEVTYTYNYRIEDIYNFAASTDELDTLGDNVQGRITMDPQSSDIAWIKVLYTICIFMFMVFVLASGSILFMKLYNDAFEEKERYLVLKKLGISGKTLKRSVSCELGAAYGMPFVVMAVSSYFSVHALENMMYRSLLEIHLISVAVILAFFLCCYLASVRLYVRNVGIE